MRINPAVQKSTVASSPVKRAAAGSGFSLQGPAAAGTATASGAALGIHSIDALLALQGVEDPTERRRRVAARANTALDLLETLKIEILEGQIGLDTLRRLEVTLKSLTERSGEPGLDHVLDAIGVRVAVEIAKRRPTAAPTA